VEALAVVVILVVLVVLQHLVKVATVVVLEQHY
jgi:hypothetical protein